MILLVMQSLDNRIHVRLHKGWFGIVASLAPGQTPLQTPATSPSPTRLPGLRPDRWEDHPAARSTRFSLDVPTTAHIIGGSTIGRTDAEAAPSMPYHRVFGYEGLHVADGSALPANLGVNPALTITAMAERAMAHWPNKGDPDPRPPLGASYLSVPVISPNRPTSRPAPRASCATRLRRRSCRCMCPFRPQGDLRARCASPSGPPQPGNRLVW